MTDSVQVFEGDGVNKAIAEREAALAQREGALAEREAALAKREAAMANREIAVQLREMASKRVIDSGGSGPWQTDPPQWPGQGPIVTWEAKRKDQFGNGVQITCSDGDKMPLVDGAAYGLQPGQTIPLNG